MLAPLTAIVLRVLSEDAANASYLVIGAYALLGRTQAVQALALSWLFTLLSLGVAPEASLGAEVRYAVLAGAAISVAVRSLLGGGAGISRPVLATLGLGVFFTGHALVFSQVPDLSLLKALSWTVAACTLLSAWGALDAAQREQLVQQLFGLLVLILLASLPLLVLPLGYLRNGTGFQGILSHPQAFGLTMAVLGVWAGGRLLALPRPPWSSLALLAGCLVLVVLSEARTAGVAMVFGLVAGVVAAPWLAGRPVRALLPGLASGRVYLAMALAVASAAVAAPSLADRVGGFIVKRSAAQSLADAYDLSRGRVIREMWANVDQDPLVGIGFGVASDPSAMLVQRDPVLGLPTSAPVEKGVVPLALWEEVGIFGLAFAIFWAWMLVRRAARNGAVPLAVLTAVLLMNLSEATLFSPGGMGMLQLVLLGWCGSRPARPKSS